MDDEFLGLAKKKIVARATAAMKSSITDKNMQKYFGGLWEREIKPNFIGASGLDHPVPVPSPFMTYKERCTRGAAPTITFTA
jgi:hypothetical protein